MAQDRYVYTSFTTGEVTPEFYGRFHDEKFAAGAAKLRNFIALPHGPVKNRPGFEFVAESKDSSVRERLIPFSYSTSQTMAIVMGPGYFRFYTDGAELVDDDGNSYEVTNSYAQGDLFEITYVQSADVMTFCHRSYPPMELRRYGALDWRFTQISFAAPIAAPTGVSASASYDTTSTSTTYAYSYVVTAINSAGDESVASSVVTVQGNLYTNNAHNTVSWNPVDGAVKYKVYKKYSGVYGYIGVTVDTSFQDDLITPNAAKVPPEYDIDLAKEGEYPGAVTYFEQRRCFAGSSNSPQTLWMTETGTESSMRMGIVTQDTDAIEVRVATREANVIRHLAPLSNLVLLTSSAEMLCQSSGGVITQTNINIKPQAYVGASGVQPVIINNVMLYVAARGNHVRELGYQWQANGIVTSDVSLRAPHLFDGKIIVDMAFSRSPYPVCWCVTNEGTLLGMTYIPEESIGGWHVHETDGKIVSCCVVTENNDDRLYVLVEREINGKTKRYVERMQNMLFDKKEDAFFVDSGLTGEFDKPVTIISGLDHLEGKTVSVLGDGAVFPQQVVENGTITLDQPVGKVTVGLPYRSLLQTLPPFFQVDGGYGTGRTKNIINAWVRVYESSGIFAGPSEDRLVEYKQRKTESPGSAPEPVSDEINIRPFSTWDSNGQVFVVQDDPLPLTVISITTEVSIGG